MVAPPKTVLIGMLAPCLLVSNPLSAKVCNSVSANMRMVKQDKSGAKYEISYSLSPGKDWYGEETLVVIHFSLETDTGTRPYRNIQFKARPGSFETFDVEYTDDVKTIGNIQAIAVENVKCYSD